MQKEKKRVPMLRFAGFEGEWERINLGKIINYTKGYAFKSNTYASEGIRIVRVSDLGADSIKDDNEKLFISSENVEGLDKYILKKKDIIVTTVGSHPDLVDSAVGRAIYVNMKDEGLLNQNLLKIEQNERVVSKFIFSHLNTSRYRYYIRGIKRGNANQSNITVNEFLQYNIFITSFSEQQKIAHFLTSIDTRIQQLEKKKTLLEHYKKGVMQKIFSQEIRFKDDDGKEFGKWEKKRLGEYLKHKSKRNKNLEIDRVLSVSNTKGFILQSEQFDNHRVASKDVSNYKIVNKNEIAYNPSRINVGSIATLKNFEVGIVSPMYVVLSLKSNLNPIFFENLTSTHLFKHLVKIGCSGSVRDSLNFEDLESFKIKIPCLAEQTKIALFLSALDTKIAVVNEQVERTKEYKKGLLQQLFV